MNSPARITGSLHELGLSDKITSRYREAMFLLTIDKAGILLPRPFFVPVMPANDNHRPFPSSPTTFRPHNDDDDLIPSGLLTLY